MLSCEIKTCSTSGKEVITYYPIQGKIVSLAAVLKKKVKKVVAITFLHQPDPMNGVDVR